MTKHYVDANGVSVGGFGEGSYPTDPTLVDIGEDLPDYADQIWLFPGWSTSPSQLRLAETVWREAEMPIAKENVTAIQFEDPDALPGTEAQWKAYWVALRNWTDSNPYYPDSTKRPVRPS